MTPEPTVVPLRLVAPAAPPPSAPELLAAGLDMAYQPIVHLGTGAVVAYEALARPRHPLAGNPLQFFTALEQAGLRLSGERSAFEAAVTGVSGGGSPRLRSGKTKLFVNASPLTLVDPDFDVTELLRAVERHGLAPSDVVIEVTESEAVDDIATLSRRARRLRRMGMGVAVDDAGAGHASFRVITRLRPSFIKIDRDLVTGVDVDGARLAFIEAMVRFARQIGSRLIAEGIETEAELACLAALGVEAGQGYYLARPSVGELPLPSPQARRMIATAAQRVRLGGAMVTAGELARPPVVVEDGTTVREGYARFLSTEAQGLVVVGSDGRGVAQVSRRAVERALAGPGSWERMAEQPIGVVAEVQPLSVDADLDVLEVAAILAARSTSDALDEVAVTDALGRLVGVLPVRDVLRTLSDAGRSREQDLNPVTGLVGAAGIDADLARRLSAGEAVSVAFLDIRGFRRLNEAGGYALGDEVLRLVARCLGGVAGGLHDAVVAHLGADDFVVAVSPSSYEELITELIRSVEAEVLPAVRTELRLRGVATEAELAVAMATVDLQGTPPPGLRALEWARDQLVPLMTVAREQEGHACVHQRDGAATLATWTHRAGRRREIRVGMLPPQVVLDALDLIDRSWAAFWAGSGGEDPTLPTARFPGPVSEVKRLQRTFAGPLREAAGAALEAGLDALDVVLDGDEEDLLGLLDRVAMVTQRVYARRTGSVPPEVAVLDRLLRHRARAVTRADMELRTASGTSRAPLRPAG